MAAVTVTVDADLAAVRVDVELGPAASTASIVRRPTEPAGAAWSPVRVPGADPGSAGLSGGRVTVWDAEAPLDVAVVYRVEAAGVALNSNTSFEAAVLGWEASNTGTAVTRSTVRAHDGAASMLVAATAAADGPSNAGARAERVPVVAGVSYVAAGWVYVPGGWSSVATAVDWFTADGTVLSSSFTPVAVPADRWTYLSNSYPAPAGAGSAALRFRLGDNPLAPLRMFVDEAVIVPTMATAVTSTVVTVPSGGVWWLKDPLRPANSLRLIRRPVRVGCVSGPGTVFLGVDAETFAAGGSVFEVDGARRPVAVYGPRRDATAALRLLTLTFPDRDALAGLLAAGSPLLLQSPPGYGVAEAYLHVGDATCARLVSDHRWPGRLWTLPYTVVDPPVGPAQGMPGVRWVDVAARYRTWADLAAAGLTWGQVQQQAQAVA